MKFPQAAIHAIKHYHWQGNVRALRHAIERAVILTEADTFQLKDFYFVEQSKQQKNHKLKPLSEAHAESRREELDCNLNFE